MKIIELQIEVDDDLDVEKIVMALGEQHVWYRVEYAFRLMAALIRTKQAAGGEGAHIRKVTAY